MPPAGIAASCLARAVVCAPAFQACGITSGSVRPVTLSKSTPGASTMRSAVRTAPEAIVTLASTGSIDLTSPNTVLMPYLLTNVE